MRFKVVTVGLVLAGTALGSAALTLGRARGAAWIGQSLELQIPVQLDAGQTDSIICAEADIFYGDTRIDAGRVLLRTEANNQGEGLILRVGSSAMVDEPVVSVYLRAGCSQKSSRKYVLLADFPVDSQSIVTRSEPVAPLITTAITPAAAEPAPVVASVQPVDNLAPPEIKPAATPEPMPAPKAETPPAPTPQPKPAAVAAPKPEAKVAKEPPKKKEAAPAKKPEKPAQEAAAPKEPAKPRLRLDPVDSLTERVKSVEATTTQTALQEDLAREAQKMQQLQSDLRTLLDQAAKNEAALTAMRERLEKAEAERVPMAVVYALVLLVGLCVAGLAFLWTRRARPLHLEGRTAGKAAGAPSSAD